MTAKEVLRACDDVTNDDGGSEWVEDVLVVRVQNQTF